MRYAFLPGIFLFFSLQALAIDLIPKPQSVQLLNERPLNRAHFAERISSLLDSPDAEKFVSDCPDPRVRAELRRNFEISKVHIQCESIAPQIPELGIDESYRLKISESGVSISAPTSIGALRALASLHQLNSSPGGFIPAVIIEDRPRFPWRGLLIDVARHWLPLEVIKRQIDAMALAKLNVLHLHLSDDQGFRFESLTHPLLHGVGSEGKYYTQNQLKELVRYAAARGIRVVPEIDVPGHVSAMLAAYPHLGSLPLPYEISNRWGVHDASLDPTREEVYRFLEALFSEVAAIFPDRHLHFGGDEVTGRHWNSSPSIRQFMAQKGIGSPVALQAYFNRRVAEILRSLGKTPVGWDETLSSELSDDVLVQVWRSPQYLERALKQGNSAILSYGFYLDHHLSASQHYLMELENTPGMLGGEACMWGEFVDETVIDSRIWPRAAAVAERLWSSADAQDIADLYRRLSGLTPLLEEHGLSIRQQIEKRLAELSAEGAHYDALKELASVLEPAKYYMRHRHLTYTPATPFDRLVDALPSESEKARTLGAKVEVWLQNPMNQKLSEELWAQFARWRKNDSQLFRTLKGSERLEELKELSKDLAVMGWIAQEAMAYLRTDATPPHLWAHQHLHRLKEISPMKAGMENALTHSVTQMVLAASLTEVSTRVTQPKR